MLKKVLYAFVPSIILISSSVVFTGTYTYKDLQALKEKAGEYDHNMLLYKTSKWIKETNEKALVFNCENDKDVNDKKIFTVESLDKNGDEYKNAFNSTRSATNESIFEIIKINTYHPNDITNIKIDYGWFRNVAKATIPMETFYIYKKEDASAFIIAGGKKEIDITALTDPSKNNNINELCTFFSKSLELAQPTTQKATMENLSWVRFASFITFSAATFTAIGYHIKNWWSSKK